MFPGWANAGCFAVTLYVGEGPRGSNGARSPLHQISVFHSATHSQTGPLWCWFPSGWACARSRPLWVSPMTSPVRLGVSPAAATTPTGVFNQRSEALFPQAGALGCAVCFAPHRLSGLSVCECGATGCYPPLCLPHSPPLLSPAFSVYLCANVGPQGLPATTPWGLLAAAWPTPFHNPPPHWVRQLLPCRTSSPPLLPVWMNVYSLSPWSSDFLTVRFCQFWLFFVFKLLPSFWLCEEAQCV